MKYEVEIRKAKANGKCRCCQKQVSIGQLVAIMSYDDGYNTKSMMLHTNCFLKEIIRKTKQIEMQELKNKVAQFDKIEKLLNEENIKHRTKKRIIKHKPEAIAD